MFDQKTFAGVGAHSTASPALYTYSTKDTKAQVLAEGYFAPKRDQLNDGDCVVISAADGGLFGRVSLDRVTVVDLLASGGGGGGGGDVASVFGRTGAIVAQSGDYSASQVTNSFDKVLDNSDAIASGVSNLFMTTAERSKLLAIEAGAEVNTINGGDNVSSLANDAGYTDNTGTVTSVSAGTGLTGGPITGAGSLSLADTTVTPGSYTNVNLTVDAQGRITAVSNGSGGGGGSSVYGFNRVIGTATQSVTSTLTAITWNSSADSSGSDITYSLANPTRLTVATTGVYRIGGYAAIQTEAQRPQAALELIVNGTPTGLQRSGSYIRNSGFSYDYWTMEVSATPMTLTAGDYIELGVGQVFGAVYGYDGIQVMTCDSSKSEFWLERVK